MKYITLAILICMFLLLRPYQMQSLGLCYRGDDFSYFAHATSIVYGEFTSYENEYYEHGDEQPLHSIGPGLMASPFVFVFSLIDRVVGADIVKQRTADNIRQSWSMFGFVVASVVFFWWGCWCLYATTIRFFPNRQTVMAVILMVIVQGIPIYVFRRPIFSHVYEFFLQSMMVYLFFKPHSDRRTKWWYWLSISVTLCLMPLVRYNNLVASVCWWMALQFKHKIFANVWAEKRWWHFVALSVVVISMGFIALKILAGPSGYEGKLGHYFKWSWLSIYPMRIWHVLTNTGWGLIYTTPFILIGLWQWLRRPFPEKRYLNWCLLAMLVNFHIIATSDGQGGYYGYRYFICSMIPLMVIPFAGWLRDMESKYSGKIYGLIALIALFPLFGMLCFEGNNSTLTLKVIKLHDGYGFSNETYQWQVWKLLFTQPVEWLIAVFKGGLLYFVYVFANLLGLQSQLPDIVLEKYPEFRSDILLKVLILYALPIGLLGLNRFARKIASDTKSTY